MIQLIFYPFFAAAVLLHHLLLNIIRAIFEILLILFVVGSYLLCHAADRSLEWSGFLRHLISPHVVFVPIDVNDDLPDENGRATWEQINRVTTRAGAIVARKHARQSTDFTAPSLPHVAGPAATPSRSGERAADIIRWTRTKSESTALSTITKEDSPKITRPTNVSGPVQTRTEPAVPGAYPQPSPTKLELWLRSANSTLIEENMGLRATLERNTHDYSNTIGQLNDEISTQTACYKKLQEQAARLQRLVSINADLARGARFFAQTVQDDRDAMRRQRDALQQERDHLIRLRDTLLLQRAHTRTRTMLAAQAAQAAREARTRREGDDERERAREARRVARDEAQADAAAAATEGEWEWTVRQGENGVRASRVPLGTGARAREEAARNTPAAGTDDDDDASPFQRLPDGSLQGPWPLGENGRPRVECIDDRNYADVFEGAVW